MRRTGWIEVPGHPDVPVTFDISWDAPGYYLVENVRYEDGMEVDEEVWAPYVDEWGAAYTEEMRLHGIEAAHVAEMRRGGERW